MLKTLMVALAGLGLSAAVSAQELVEGQHYTLLESPVATQVDEDQIEVTEAFWFGCPHCYRLQTPVNEWYETLDNIFRPCHRPHFSCYHARLFGY